MQFGQKKIRVISKLNERTAQVRFETTYKHDFRSNIPQHEHQCHFIGSIVHSFMLLIALISTSTLLFGFKTGEKVLYAQIRNGTYFLFFYEIQVSATQQDTGNNSALVIQFGVILSGGMRSYFQTCRFLCLRGFKNTKNECFQ